MLEKGTSCFFASFLSFSHRDLKLKYSNVYDLHVRLPYPVFDKKGAAKFDKAKKQLSITLPVQPAVIAPTSPVVDESSPGTFIDTLRFIEIDVEPEPESNPSINEPVRRAKEPSKSHGRWVEGKHHEITSDESRQLAQEVRKKAEEAQKLASESVKSPPSPLPVEAPVNPSEGKDGSQSQTEFIPAAVFIGRKPGYAFKRGDQGLGYYIDRYQNSSSSLPESLSQSKPVDTPVASPKSPLSSLDHHLPNPELEHRSFVYEFRQTKEAVAVIIQVPGIIESTVDLKFGKRSFDIYFKAVAADTSTRRVVEYSQGFDLYDEIESDKCKYDVATQNLVILLHKSKAEYWIDKGTSGGAVAGGEQSSKKDILAPRAYRSSVAEMSEKDYGESGRTGIAIPSPTELLEAMKFSTQGLLDLD